MMGGGGGGYNAVIEGEGVGPAGGRRPERARAHACAHLPLDAMRTLELRGRRITLASNR